MRYWLVVTSLAVLAMGGCSSGPIIQPPLARVVGVKLVQQTDQGARVDVTVVLENHNAVPLPLTQSDYSVSVTGGGTYASSDEPSRTIPASGQQEVLIPAVFATRNHLQGAGYSLQGSITYEPPGGFRKLLTQIMVPLPSVPFSATGKLE